TSSARSAWVKFWNFDSARIRRTLRSGRNEAALEALDHPDGHAPAITAKRINTRRNELCGRSPEIDSPPQVPELAGPNLRRKVNVSKERERDNPILMDPAPSELSSARDSDPDGLPFLAGRARVGRRPLDRR